MDDALLDIYRDDGFPLLDGKSDNLLSVDLGPPVGTSKKASSVNEDHDREFARGGSFLGHSNVHIEAFRS
jgi:hypothetical protein